MSDYAVSNMPLPVSSQSSQPGQIHISVTEAVAETTQIELRTDIYSADQLAQIETSSEDIKINLSEALKSVSDEGQAEMQLSVDEVSALEQRREDLVMWLLNLELRLTPYCNDFA